MHTAQTDAPTLKQTDEPTPRKPLRLWPGVVLVALQLLSWLVVPVVVPEAAIIGFFGGLACGLVVLVWWLFFSRARWFERVGAVVLMVVAVIATRRIVHPSIAGGAMGFLFYVYAIPALSLALVAAMLVGRRLSDGPRRALVAFHPARVRGVDARADGRHHRRRRF